MEALQNVQKYAAAQSAVVKLDGSESGLTFEVTDDGQGFDDTAVKRGAGLTNMTRLNLGKKDVAFERWPG